MKREIKRLNHFLRLKGLVLEAEKLNELIKSSAPDGLYPTKEDLWRSKYYDEVWTSDRDREVSDIRGESSKILADKAKSLILDSEKTFIEIKNYLIKNKQELSKGISDAIEDKKDLAREEIKTYKRITDKADKYFDKTEKRIKLDQQIDALSKSLDSFEESTNPKIKEIEKKFFGSSSIDLSNTNTIIDFLIKTIDKILKRTKTLASKTEEFLLQAQLSSELRISLSEAIYNYRLAKSKSGIFYIPVFFHSMFAVTEAIIQLLELPSEDQEELDQLMINLLRMCKEFVRLMENMLKPLSYIIPTFGEQNE